MMYEYKCEIVRVVDGDTVDVNIDLGFNTWLWKERIRLNGIDTPESRTRDPEEKKAGLYAKSVVEGFFEYMIRHYVGVAYEGQSKELIKEQQLRNISYLKAQGLID